MPAPLDTLAFHHDRPPPNPALAAAMAGQASGLRFHHARLHKRAFHDTYALTGAEGDVFFMRLYRPGYWPDEEVIAEMQILRALQAAGQPVALPWTGPDGSMPLRLDLEGCSYQAVIFPALGGSPPPALDTDTAKSFAAALAVLHGAMDRLDTNRRYRQDQRSLPAFILPPMQELLGPADMIRLRACLSACLTALGSIPAKKPFFGLCHGDTHTGNWLLWNGAVRFLDFDHCGHMWRIHDLAVALWDAFSFSPGADVSALSSALIGGYQTIRPLENDEKAALLPACALRHLWWAALHIRMGHRDGAFARKAVQQAEEWLDTADTLP